MTKKTTQKNQVQSSNRMYVLGNMALDHVTLQDYHQAIAEGADEQMFFHNEGNIYKPGGGGPYSFFAALASGADAVLLTSGTENHQLIQFLKGHLPEEQRWRIKTLSDTTTFRSEQEALIDPYPDFKPVFDFEGKRTLYSHQPGRLITQEAIEDAGVDIEEGSTVLVASVFNEANADLFMYLQSKGARIISTIQGSLRETDNDGRIIAKPLSPDFKRALGYIDTVIFSDEDVKGLSDEEISFLTSLPEQAIMTQGKEGCTLFTRTDEGELVEYTLPAYGLSEQDNDLMRHGKAEAAQTGLGDVTGAVLAHGLHLGVKPWYAYRDAAVTAAIKIELAIHEARSGVTGVPTVEEIIDHMYAQEGRFHTYAQSIEGSLIKKESDIVINSGGIEHR